MILEDLKQIMLSEVNQIKGDAGAFNPDDADSAYDEAMRECGFEFPSSDTSDDDRKQILWLKKRMRRWFVAQLWQRNIEAHKSGDMEGQSIPVNFERIIKNMDAEFLAAKETEDVLALSGDVPLSVIPTGLVEDRIGQSIEDRTGQ
jgi:hypothetical protein